MKGTSVNLGEVSAENTISCIKYIVENMSVNDIDDIVFRSGNLQTESAIKNESFLLEGEARTDYGKICEVFDDFITGPGLERREITELTESYQQFYSEMQDADLDIQIQRKLEDALASVAIESEMQGFIYGFRMFEEMVMRRIPEMQEVVV